MNEPVLVERRDEVLVVTLNRPDARNAVDPGMAHGVAAAMDVLDTDPGLVLGVLTGAGGVFCAGMDLKAFAAGESPTVPGRGFCGLVQRPPRKPLIAAVEGFALAGGFEVALACDLIVSARDARFGIPEVKRGLVAAGGGLIRLPKRVPYHLAMELALTGEPIEASRAADLGLVNVLADPGGALEAALALAATITPNAPMALHGSKQIVAAALDWSDAEAWERQRPVIDEVFSSEDALAGATAFAQKRAPVWRGR